MNPNISKRRHAKAAAANQNDDRQHTNGHGHSGHQQINVGETERQLSMVGGTVLAVCGLLRGSFSGLALATIGAAFIWRGHTGHCEMYHLLGHSTADDSPSDHSPTNPPAHEQSEPRFQGHETYAAGEV